MDTTPKSKSASRLARMAMESDHESEQIPQFNVEFASPAKRRTPSSVPSKVSCARPAISIPLNDLLVLSPARRCRARTSSIASPRTSRRARRRLEVEEREFAAAEEAGRMRRRRRSEKCSKEKLTIVNSTLPSPKENEREERSVEFDRVGQSITDLIMWKDVAKSSLWFGFGCLCFFSSCFPSRFSFSIFSAASKLGLLFLGLSFLSTALLQRSGKRQEQYNLTEDEVLRLARVILPVLNLAVSRTTRLFSGEASMTLKVAAFLAIGAEYGHLLTLWRICAICFFASFSVPKLHSLYAAQIELKVEHSKLRFLEAWQSFSHKKVIIASIATAFWNLSSLKTRFFAAFLALVVLRYFRQCSDHEGAIAEEKETKLHQAMVVTEAM